MYSLNGGESGNKRSEDEELALLFFLNRKKNASRATHVNTHGGVEGVDLHPNILTRSFQTAA